MTLDELYTRPAFRVKNYGGTSLRSAGRGLRVYLEGNQKRKDPHLQAFAFYLLDHLVALIKNKYQGKSLPHDLERVVGLYHNVTTMFSSDMYAYLLVICNREFRYCKSPLESYQQLKEVKTKAGLDFAYGLKNIGKDDAASRLIEYNGDATLGEYCSIMREGYNRLAWGSSFGGKKWGDIAEVLENFVLGKMPLVALLDQSFSLQHNTAAIFNKGVIYNKESSNLATILDLQHAGQIPALANDAFFGGLDPFGLTTDAHEGITTSLKQALVLVAKHIDGLDQHVDWAPLETSNTATSKTKINQYHLAWLSKFGVYTVTKDGPKHTKFYKLGDKNFKTYVRGSVDEK